MVTGNPAKKPRKFFEAANKYQNAIMILSFLPAALIFLSFICIVFVGNPALYKTIFHIDILTTEKSLNQFSEIIISLMCSLFLLSLVLAFIISHNMVGAFERIIRELDEIIAGRSQKTISSRPKDTLSKELLKRINILIEHYVKNEKKIHDA